MLKVRPLTRDGVLFFVGFLLKLKPSFTNSIHHQPSFYCTIYSINIFLLLLNSVVFYSDNITTRIYKAHIFTSLSSYPPLSLCMPGDALSGSQICLFLRQKRKPHLCKCSLGLITQFNISVNELSISASQWRFLCLIFSLSVNNDLSQWLAETSFSQ